MRKVRMLLALAPAALVAALAPYLGSTAWPLGVRGEWEWLRLTRGPSFLAVLLAATAVLAYAAVAALGLRFLARLATRIREIISVGLLVTAAVAVQLVVPVGAPEGYGLVKWAFVLHSPASTGYYTVARREINDTGLFLARYPEWIQRQDALHVGTHPPGLFLVEHWLLQTLRERPELARRVVDCLPATVETGFRTINESEPLPTADRAALGLSGALTLLACAATVVPLYALGRAYLPAPAAWSTAVLWPLVPAAVLFQPDADTAFPLLSATALALAAHAARVTSGWAEVLAAASGAVLALGMGFTLAFLPAGLVVAIVLACAPSVGSRRARLLLATGAGFLAPTLAFWVAAGADPFVIWWWNQQNHARFYDEFHRTYRLWLLVNPLELAVALGIPAAFWALAGFGMGRAAPRVAWAALVVLALLTLSGRNLSEVARLWLPFMPALLTAAGAGLLRVGAGPGSLAALVATMGAETLLLQATIQVVYPVSQ